MERILRPLASMEYAYFLMDIAIRNNFTFVATLSPAIPLPVLDEAVSLVQARHPLLNASIVLETKTRPVFAVSDAPARVRRLEGEDRQAALEAEHGERFDVERGPLFRVAVLEREDGQDLFFTFHHSVADGLSGARTAMDILSAADSLLSGKRPDLPPLPELGPAEARIDLRFTGAGKAAGAVFRMAGNSVKVALGRYGRLPLDKKVQPAERKELFILRSLSREETRDLLARARAAGVSVHALLSAAQLISEAREISGEKPSRLVHLSLVDLRKRLVPPVSEEHSNVYIGAAETVLSVSPDGDLKELARRISQGLSSEMDQGSHFVLMPQLTALMKKTAFISPPTPSGAARVLASGEKSRPRVSPVSNLGAVRPAIPFSRFSVGGFSFVIALSGTSYFGSAALSFDERLYWNFSFATPSLSRERASAMADRAISLVKDLG
ncbi:MAG: condensation domain-containing protein [Thermodesulfobacteriota bacterium]